MLSFNKKETSFDEIISKIISDYPNLFLIFLIIPREREKVLNTYLKSKNEDLMLSTAKTIKNFGLYNLIFAFKRHLVHLGILTKENTTYYGKKEVFKADKDIWIMEDYILI